MSRLANRKRIELATKYASLTSDFDHWEGKTKGDFGLHTSQLAGLLGSPNGAFSVMAELLKRDIVALETMAPAAILQEAPPLEEMLLALHCMWGFFREKLAQRLDEASRPFLNAADELAWRCYFPAMQAAGARLEPPIVFLNGGRSPFMSSRGSHWNPEGVTASLLSDPGFAKILASLPIPVIGVPFSQLTHLPELIFVAHEVGHAVEDDFGLTSVMRNALEQALVGSAHLPTWTKWMGEIFADAWAAAHTGPAYVGALQDFLAPDHHRGGDSTYPPVALRVRLARAVITEMGFAVEAQQLANDWKEAMLNDDIFPEDPDVARIVKVLLCTPLIAGRTALALGGYDQKRHRNAQTVAVNAGNGRGVPQGDARTLLAGLRYCYENLPSGFRDQGKPNSMTALFLLRLRPSDQVRSERSRKPTPPDLYGTLRELRVTPR